MALPPAARQPDPKYETYALTFSLKNRGGIDSDSAAAIGITRWLGRCRAAYAICERHPDTSLWHIHAGLWLKVAATKSDVRKRFLALKEIKGLTLLPAELEHGLCFKIMYNNDWHARYLKKDDDHIVLLDTLPRDYSAGGCPADGPEVGTVDLDDLAESYPPPDDTQAKHQFLGDPRYLRLEQMYLETVADKRWTHAGHDMETCRAWLETSMYSFRIINVVADRRRLNQMAHSLTKFLDALPIDPDYDTSVIDSYLDKIS